MRYRILTYGCQMNERESGAIAGMLESLGFAAADPGEPEEIAVFHTCCVRESAERKIIGKVLEYKARKEANPSLVVAVGGCLPQRPGGAAALVRRAPWLDLVYGTHNLARLPVLVAMARTRARLHAETGIPPREPLVEVLPAAADGAAALPRPADPPNIKEFVNISVGCNNFCSFCIVPHVRGRERSRPPAEIVAEVESLAAAGTREVTLLGQNVNSYGHDLGAGVDFPWLLGEVDRAGRAAGMLRVRFMTSHPKDLTPRLIEAMATLPAACEHIHLPVQSGSDRILDSMNRRYTGRHYLDLVGALRAAMPGLGLTTDIIVGYPGETADDFAATLELVRAAEFDAAFTFVYSRRRGTAAADLPDQVPLDVRRERLARLNEVQEGISRSRLASLGGTTKEILIEGPSSKDPAVGAGRTRGYHYVLVPGAAGLAGRLVEVSVVKTRTWTLTGELAAAKPGDDDAEGGASG